MPSSSVLVSPEAVVPPSGASFFDMVTVFPIDVASVASPSGLVRTNIIAFVAGLANEVLQSPPQAPTTTTPLSISPSPTASVRPRRLLMVVDPSVVQCMVSFGDAALGPVSEMVEHDAVLLPVTTHDGSGATSDDMKEGGDGGHWSGLLLLRSPLTRLYDAFAFDSCRQYNQSATRRLLKLLAAALPVSSNRDVKFLESFPQQANQYDCGVMFCWLAMWLSRECSHVASSSVNATADAITGILRDHLMATMENCEQRMMTLMGAVKGEAGEQQTCAQRCATLRKEIVQWIQRAQLQP